MKPPPRGLSISAMRKNAIATTSGRINCNVNSCLAFPAPNPTSALAQNYPNGETNSAESPAQPGQYVVVYLTGQGRVEPPVATGAAPSASPLSVPLATIQAQVGGKEAHIGLAGLAPGFVGLLQMVIEIPEVAGGEQSLDVSIGGVPANTTVLSVKNAGTDESVLTANVE